MKNKVEELTQLLAVAQKGRWASFGSDQSGIDNAGATYTERRKYFLIDIILTNGQQSGLWMVDKETGFVYKIRAYGQRGVMVSEIDQLIETYRVAAENAINKAKGITE